MADTVAVELDWAFPSNKLEYGRQKHRCWLQIVANWSDYYDRAFSDKNLLPIRSESMDTRQ
jgi:hypothetical protein